MGFLSKGTTGLLTFLEVWCNSGVSFSLAFYFFFVDLPLSKYSPASTMVPSLKVKDALAIRQPIFHFFKSLAREFSVFCFSNKCLGKFPNDGSVIQELGYLTISQQIAHGVIFIQGNPPIAGSLNVWYQCLHAVKFGTFV